ncbi:DJ-1/PfpI family protein [Bremerella sp. JC770]|uniref:DJ-1/PfpI family protein n=1 Tax=Bremerella sp. JC770 TaxID=3232137 RepID=UPI003459C5E9
MSRLTLFATKQPSKTASSSRKHRRLGRHLQGLEDRRMMAGDVATAELIPLETEYVETSTVDPAAQAEWTLDPIADLEATSGQTLETMLTVSGDVEAEELIFSASIVSTIEQQLDAQYDLVESDNYHTNCLGNNERWIRASNGGWFYVMPSGEFFQWRGSFENSTLLADFDSTHYDNPDLIADPETIDASVHMDGDVLVITPDADYTGTFQVDIGATDGTHSASQTVMVAVAESVPENDPPEDTTNQPLPVLMVIANQDFYYQEYGDTRQSLEAQGLEVVVAATTTEVARPHANSGQGADGGYVTPDLALADVEAEDYSAIVFVGGWGSSSYQYAFEGTYNFNAYNNTEAIKATVNDLINDFVDQDKYVAAICHGVSVLAYARVDGSSLLEGKTVSAWAGSAPSSDQPIYSTRQNIELNGGTMVASGSVGDPTTVADDVIVDGNIITAENYDSAAMFGQVIGELVSDPEYVDAVFAQWE